MSRHVEYAEPFSPKWYFKVCKTIALYGLLAFVSSIVADKCLGLTGERMHNVASGMGGVVNGLMCSLAAIRLFQKRGAWDVSARNREDADQVFRWFSSYLIADAIYLFCFNPIPIFFLHHFVCLLCVAATWKAGRGDICMLWYILVGECTNFPYNLWLAMREVVLEGSSPAWIPVAEAVRDMIATHFLFPFMIVRIVGGPLVLWKQVYLLGSAGHAGKLRPRWVAFVWVILGLSLMPGTVGAWTDMAADGGWEAWVTSKGLWTLTLTIEIVHLIWSWVYLYRYG